MIDLHMHTIHSDGTDTVEELLQIAEKQKLEVISITDHNDIGAYKELEKNSVREKFSGKIIPGVEISTSYKNIMIEVLGYGIDYKKIKIHKINHETIQRKVLQQLKDKAKELGLKFNEKIEIDMKDPCKIFAGSVFSRELLKYKENEEIIQEKLEKFTDVTFFRVHQCNPESPFFIDESKECLSIEEAIEKIHNAGGLAFLAHPFMYPYKNKEQVIEEILMNTQLDGLECEYVEFSREERDILIDIARRNKKLVSGGTDYHHNNKPNIQMGTGKNNNILISRDFIKEWENKVYSI